MSDADAAGSERTTVRTYVPRYQKERWVDDADDADMSLSEYVRTMAQAGRRGFGFEADGEPSRAASEQGPEESPSDGLDPGGEDLETVILDRLSEEPREFDELVAFAIEDLRESMGEEVAEVLTDLQARDRIAHDPRAGGYTLLDDE